MDLRRVVDNLSRINSPEQCCRVLFASELMPFPILFGKAASCKTATMLYHFYIPQFGQILVFFTSLLGRNCPYDLKNFGLS